VSAGGGKGRVGASRERSAVFFQKGREGKSGGMGKKKVGRLALQAMTRGKILGASVRGVRKAFEDRGLEGGREGAGLP